MVEDQAISTINEHDQEFALKNLCTQDLVKRLVATTVTNNTHTPLHKIKLFRYPLVRGYRLLRSLNQLSNHNTNKIIIRWSKQLFTSYNGRSYSSFRSHN